MPVRDVVEYRRGDLISVNLSPCERDAGHPLRVALIGVNLSPCERQAGHPPGVALLETRRSCRLWSRRLE